MFSLCFMAWSRDASTDQRVKAIEELCHSYINQEVAESDVDCMEKVFTLYLNDSSVKVRQAMAMALSASPMAPKALIWSLTQDIPQVCESIYAASPHLRADDLIHAIRYKEEIIQIAIASRDDLNSACVQCLIEKGTVQGILRLLDNDGLVLSDRLKHDIAVKFGDDALIRNVLLEEWDLRPTTRQILVERLSGSLFTMVENKGWCDSARLAAESKDACNRVTVEIASDCLMDDMLDYVEHLRATNQLTLSLLVRVACSDNAAFLQASFCLLSGISLKRVQAMMSSKRDSSFRSLYGRTGLPQSAYLVFATALSVKRTGCAEDEILGAVIKQVEKDEQIDGALYTLLNRMSAEQARKAARVNQNGMIPIAA